ncbi:hypothetical protein, partial [Ralstonia solanacearum]|uniref:hypothetical protein n=1 Tax=Ralstonia solanacearum TaxID=305 RepID=UPI0019D330BF
KAHLLKKIFLGVSPKGGEGVTGNFSKNYYILKAPLKKTRGGTSFSNPPGMFFWGGEGTKNPSPQFWFLAQRPGSLQFKGGFFFGPAQRKPVEEYF